MTTKHVILCDAGREEYLDGALMRYSVQIGRLSPNPFNSSVRGWPIIRDGRTIAYFTKPGDARLFAEALAERDGREVCTVREKRR